MKYSPIIFEIWLSFYNISSLILVYRLYYLLYNLQAFKVSIILESILEPYAIRDNILLAAWSSDMLVCYIRFTYVPFLLDLCRPLLLYIRCSWLVLLIVRTLDFCLIIKQRTFIYNCITIIIIISISDTCHPLATLLSANSSATLAFDHIYSGVTFFLSW